MEKTYGTNKKAYFEYVVIEKFDAGMELFGHEVKSIKKEQINLGGAYVILKNSEVFLINATIPPYQPKNTPKNYDSQRSRKLLLTKKEMAYLSGKSKEKGLTLLPLRCYIKGRFIKLEFGLAKKKKAYDKRESIRKKETKRNIGKELKVYQKA